MTILEQSTSSELADYAPVILDSEPSEPELPDAVKRWNDLAAETQDALFVEHNQNAERVMPMPRPAWADPDQDYLDDSIAGCAYQSAVVRVPVSNSRGANDGLHWARASVDICVGVFGVGNTFVSISARKKNTADKWVSWGHVLTAAEAVELAKVLIDAADLIGGAE